MHEQAGSVTVFQGLVLYKLLLSNAKLPLVICYSSVAILDVLLDYYFHTFNIEDLTQSSHSGRIRLPDRVNKLHHNNNVCMQKY